MRVLLSLTALCCFIAPIASDVIAQDTKPQPSAQDLKRKVTLQCAPRKLWLGDTLTIKLSVPHGRDLAILGPADKFFWLRSWEPQNRESTAQWYAFEKQGELKLITSEAQGVVSQDSERIFTKTGWYKIRVSYNLETDDGTPMRECKVYFVNGTRPPVK